MYNHKLIEKKWQDFWEKNKTFITTESTDRKKNIYVLDMFPYPSGAGLHVGHIEGYSATDVFARYKRLNGFNVLHPIGWDAFGLPAEQYALETKNHPATFTNENIQNFRRQLKSMGFSYDYDKEVNTTDPNYYKWTQWIFVQLYKKGLAEYKEVNVNWCPKLGTVLANEEIVKDSKGKEVSERGGYPVFKKPMKQWVLKITKYAEQLVKGLDGLNWPSSLISLQKNWIGLETQKGKQTTKLRDWIFSRQRFWGEPFPIAFDEKGQIYLVEELPVTLPKDVQIKPAYDGTSPLSNIPHWVNFTDKNKKMKRETNTMPQWAGSSWYYLAYILKTKEGYIPLGTKQAFEKLKRWLPVDLYIGGQEHAVLHLLYARFWHKVLYDLKVVPTKEPFFRIINQGMILGEDGQKMSKSKNNGINPDEIIDIYGADALRVYELFMAAITDDKPWSINGIQAIHKWIERIYFLFEFQIGETIELVKDRNTLAKELNICINKVTQDLEELKFNTAISQLMILLNAIFTKKQINEEIIEKFLVMLSPFAPHISDELLYKYFQKDASKFKWPKCDYSKIKELEKTIVVQVLGKLRGTLTYSIEKELSESELLEDALKIPRVIQAIGSKKVSKSIYLRNKLINIIIK